MARVVVAKFWDGAAFTRANIEPPVLSEVQRVAGEVAGAAGLGKVDVYEGGPDAREPLPLDEGRWTRALLAAAGVTERVVVRLCLVPAALDGGAGERPAAAAAPSTALHGERVVEKPVQAPRADAGAPPPCDVEARKRAIGELNCLWLPMLQPGSPARAVVLECRSVGITVRVVEGGGVDALGCVGQRATMHARAVAKSEEGHQVLLLSSAWLPGAYLAPDIAGAGADRPKIAARGDGGASCRFEAVPHTKRPFKARTELRQQGFSEFGIALRHVETGRFVERTSAGGFQLAATAAAEDEQDAELFLFRYQPRFDEAWKTDGQYVGRRHWIADKDKELKYYTFEEFLQFVEAKGVKGKWFGETGIIAAKLLWAISWEEGASDRAKGDIACLAKAMDSRRPYVASDRSGGYTFSEMLSFMEARAIRWPGKTEIELVSQKFLA